ncbi:AraC family transcriptional regulator [Pseudomonas graminis]|uniref:AraC family transcriptional regulator n=1 Tax=Pseudomonas graminis TaxID=158627 RepID=UPI003C19A2B5
MTCQNPVKRLDQPVFWRDAQLPFIEARSIDDGRKVCYSRHSHDVFSIGAITAGQSTYLHEKTTQTIAAGTVVLMNPGEVHACNPIDDQPWSYLMLYVNAQWLGALQRDCGVNNGGMLRGYPATHSRDPLLFKGLLDLHRRLVDSQLDTLAKQEAAVGFFSLVEQRLGGSTLTPRQPNPKVERAARYIDAHYLQPIRLEDLCAVANLSEAYLIRAFEQHYHMTPHAWLVNRRIQHGQAQLRSGEPIADIAQQSGFADQAHFQRAFKKHLAVTPGQYKP